MCLHVLSNPNCIGNPISVGVKNMLCRGKTQAKIAILFLHLVYGSNQKLFDYLLSSEFTPQIPLGV